MFGLHSPWTYCEHLTGDAYTLCDDEFHHLKQVLRCKGTGEIVAFNGRGDVRLGRLIFEKKSGIVQFTAPQQTTQPHVKQFNLVQFLPNNVGTFEDILRKACELGIQNVYTVLGERTELSVWQGWDKREKRFQRILREACKQAKNPFLPKLHTPVDFAGISFFDLGNCFYGSLQAVKSSLPKNVEGNVFSGIIGPEGGFSSNEEQVLAKVACGICLPTQVLRVETAVVSLLSVMKVFYT